MRYLTKLIESLSIWLIRLGGFLLALMVGLICIETLLDIFGLGISIPGTSQLKGWLGAGAAALALGYTLLINGHLRTNVVTGRLPRVVQRTVDALSCLVFMFFFGFIAGEITFRAYSLMINGSPAEGRGLVLYPFIFLMGLGYAGLALIFLIELWKTLIPERSEADELG
ncbi:MAG: TRAP transporter small permease subunit [Deltaproteobacteria bacterium]|nr:TRAP transporter small permease subunit [Deltaproteobacteria bacterium]